MTQIIFNPHLEGQRKRRNPAQGGSLFNYGGGSDGQHGATATANAQRGQQHAPILLPPLDKNKNATVALVGGGGSNSGPSLGGGGSSGGGSPSGGGGSGLGPLGGGGGFRAVL